MSFMTMPASVMPNMAVMWHREPLVDTLLNVIGDSEAVSVTAVPRFGSSSSEYTHWNLRDGCNPVFLKRRRSGKSASCDRMEPPGVYARGVYFEGSSHRGIKFGSSRARSINNKQMFVG